MTVQTPSPLRGCERLFGGSLQVTPCSVAACRLCHVWLIGKAVSERSRCRAGRAPPLVRAAGVPGAVGGRSAACRTARGQRQRSRRSASAPANGCGSVPGDKWCQHTDKEGSVQVEDGRTLREISLVPGCGVGVGW